MRIADAAGGRDAGIGAGAARSALLSPLASRLVAHLRRWHRPAGRRYSLARRRLGRRTVALCRVLPSKPKLPFHRAARAHLVQRDAGSRRGSRRHARRGGRGRKRLARCGVARQERGVGAGRGPLGRRRRFHHRLLAAQLGGRPKGRGRGLAETGGGIREDFDGPVWSPRRAPVRYRARRPAQPTGRPRWTRCARLRNPRRAPGAPRV